MSPQGRKHFKTPKITPLLLAMTSKTSRPKVQQGLSIREAMQSSAAAGSPPQMCDYRCAHTQLHLNQRVPKFQRLHAARLSPGFTAHPGWGLCPTGSSMPQIHPDTAGMGTELPQYFCLLPREADAGPGWVHTQFSLPRSKNSTQGNSRKLTTFWVDTEIPEMPRSILGMRAAFMCFLVINGVLLPRVHGGDAEESQQGLPGNQDPQVCLGNFSLLIPRQCRPFDVQSRARHKLHKNETNRGLQTELSAQNPKSTPHGDPQEMFSPRTCLYPAQHQVGNKLF